MPDDSNRILPLFYDHYILQSETAVREVVGGDVREVVGGDVKTKSPAIGSMTNFQNTALPTCILALAQHSGFWGPGQGTDGLITHTQTHTHAQAPHSLNGW